MKESENFEQVFAKTPETEQGNSARVRAPRQNPNGTVKTMSAQKQKTITLFVLLTIPVIHWLVFWFYINIQTIVLAFLDTREGTFTFANFGEIWDKIIHPTSSANSVGTALINTLRYFSVSIFVNMPICLVIAYFFYKRIMGYKFFRIVFYLPAIISSMVLVTAYKEFIDPLGPVGKIIELFGGKPNPKSLLEREETVTSTIMVYYILTSFTTNVLLFQGAMSRVPIEVIEAAKMDGCGPARELISIIFPIIWPTFSTQLIFAFSGIFNSSGPILLFTNGDMGTTTVSFWIFRQVYGADGGYGGTGDYNLVSAAGLIFTLVGFPIVMLTRWLVGKVEVVEY